MAFVNPPSWQPPVSQTKFFEPQPPGTVPATPFVDEEDSGWWGGVQQAGALIALAFALEASALSANTAVNFEAQHQDELSRGSVIEETYNFYDDKSVPPWDSSYPAYLAPFQDEISRGPVVDEIYEYKAAPSIEPILLPAPYWFDPNELSRGPAVEDQYNYKSAPSLDADPTLLHQWTFDQGDFVPAAVFVPLEDYWFQQAAPPQEIFTNVSYFYDSGDPVPQPVVGKQNYINTGTNNYVSQRIGEGVEF